MSRDRDRILEQALKHELRAAGTPPAAECLDAETLAAWVDDGLDARAAAAAEAHVSNCARCQSLSATFARGTPDPHSTPGTQGTPGTFSLWRWWLAPIAAGVTAITLWMVIPEDQPPLMSIAPSQERQAAAPSSTVITPDAPAPAAPPVARAESERFADRDTAAGARENRAEPSRVAESKQEAAAPVQDRVALAESGVGATATAAQRAEAPAAPPPPPSPPRPAPMLPPAVAAEAPAEIGALQKSAVTPAIEVPSIQPSRKWRITGDRIERTDDGGATWRVQRQMPNEAIAAGSAPAGPVAWFVGRAGLVLLTTDSGATFTDVSLAEPLDVASVSAADARRASIFTVTGRRFRTEDGGRTWQPF